MRTISTYVVEDEPRARAGLARLVAEAAGFHVVGSAATVADAARDIFQMSPDLLLLDVQLRDGDGLTLLDEIKPLCQPAVIFVTVHDQHALTAFDLAAVDYVVKPFTDARMYRALERARSLLDRPAQANGAQDASGTDNAAQPSPQWISRLLVPDPDGRRVLPVSELVRVEAQRYYVRLHARAGTHLLRMSLTQLEARLDPREFVRISRSAIVRVSEIVRLRPARTGRWDAVLKDGTTLHIAPPRLSALEERFGVGSDSHNRV